MPRLRAFIHECDDYGRRTKPAERVFAVFAYNNRPQVFEISIPDKRTTRHRFIQITRAEIERALSHPAVLKPEGE